MELKQQLFRVFKLIGILNTTPRKTVKQLINILGSSSSDVYRLLDLLTELGYPVKKGPNYTRYLEFNISEKDRNTFVKEELSYLQDILQQHAGASPLAVSILNKFDRNLNLIPLADSLPHLHVTRMIQIVTAGIEMDKCLMLRRYTSLTGEDVRDRFIEPLEITEDKKYLIGWDKEADDQRQFKIIRIQDIEIIEEKISEARVASPMDIFGLTGVEWLSVRMEISSLAHNLLVEEFPFSTPFIKKRNGQIVFDGMVRNWKGIGRFVLGMPSEFKNIHPPEFKDYLKAKITAFEDSL